eukprot:7389777-Prymnesium_polylepis.1
MARDIPRILPPGVEQKIAQLGRDVRRRHSRAVVAEIVLAHRRDKLASIRSADHHCELRRRVIPVHLQIPGAEQFGQLHVYREVVGLPYHLVDHRVVHP